MNRFTISDIARFSCIKQHTIRIWELRFDLLKPERNKGNFRYYTLDDVEYLLKVSLLSRAGYKISTLSKMNSEDIDKNLSKLTETEDIQCREINKLITCMYSLDIEEFEAVVDNCIVDWGIDTTIENLILPFLERVNILSCSKCTTEIDFVVAVLRKKLILGIESIAPFGMNEKTVLLFLPEGEHFDLLLLYLNYLIKKIGFQILYLGTNVSLDKLKSVTELKQPDALITYLSPNHKLKANFLTEYIREQLPGKSLVVTGKVRTMLHTGVETSIKSIPYEDVLLKLKSSLEEQM